MSASSQPRGKPALKKLNFPRVPFFSRDDAPSIFAVDALTGTPVRGSSHVVVCSSSLNGIGDGLTGKIGQREQRRDM